jgi:putative transposase
MRQRVMADIELQMKRTKYPLRKLLKLYGISKSAFYDWKEPLAVRPQRQSPFRLLPEEVNNILEFRDAHKEVGYRKLTWMMNDAGVAFATESTVYKVLKSYNLLHGFNGVENQDTEKEYRNKPRYWHTDIAYIKIRGVFYFLVMVLDGYSRFLLHWDLLSDMNGRSIEDFILEAKEKYPHAKPMLIHDNGGQFISLDFKRLVNRLEIQQVRTRRNHPQTNGKIERMNGTVKSEAIRPFTPGSYAEARELLNRFSFLYNHHRLHAGISYLRPADMFFDNAKNVLDKRNQNLRLARKARFVINTEGATTNS